MELRPAVFTKGRVIAIGAILVGVLGLFVGLPRYLRYREHREAVEREAAEAPYRNEQAQLEQQLAARLGPIATLAGSGPASCTGVTGPVPVVQAAWLAYALSHDAYPNAPLLSSAGLLYWAGAWTPSDVAGLAKKTAAERELLAAKYVVLVAADSTAVQATSDVGFKGGEVKGELLVIDVAGKAIACAAPIDTQPGFVVAVKQDTADGDRWAMQSAERDAVAGAFWTGVDDVLARMAPGAKAIKAP